jgi:uracil-DNA glycosylase
MTDTAPSKPAGRLDLWVACKQRIASCHQCLDRWPSRVEATLGVDEIPDPPPSIALLFVGVAPPPIGSDEDDEPGHFYSDPCDRLRLGLFHVVDRVLATDLTQRNRVSREAGTTAFLKAGLFFLHAAKVRPVRGRLSPDRSTMRFCAKRHLVDEIELLQPAAICFLGATKTGPAAETVFQRVIGEVPEKAEVRRPDGTKVWGGWAAVTVQPLRGTKEGPNRERVASVVEQLRDRVKAQDASAGLAANRRLSEVGDK